MYRAFLSHAGLSVERLHALLLLKEHGSLIKAADGDPVRQSRLSHHLRELSAFMGTSLTKRDGRSIKLTQAGEELALMVKDQFQALMAFQSRHTGKLQQVSVGAGDSLLQWLLIPALGAMQSTKAISQRVRTENLRTTDLVHRIQEQRIDFAIVRRNALPPGLAFTDLGVVRHAVIVPRKLAARRMSLKSALLEIPHATVAGDGELVQKLRKLAVDFGGDFQPTLVCDSLGQCISAVKTGMYAAVLPNQVWEQVSQLDCETINNKALEELDRPVVLAWSPRNLEAFGAAITDFKNDLSAALTEEATRIGLMDPTDEQEA